MTIVEMRVHMDCAGCESKIKKVLGKLEGVDEIDIDMAMQKVTVTGWADQKKVLKTVRKTGRRAELWPFPYQPEHHPYTQQYYHQQHQSHHQTYTAPRPSSSYNYYKHGYDDHGYGYCKCRNNTHKVKMPVRTYSMHGGDDYEGLNLEKKRNKTEVRGPWLWAAQGSPMLKLAMEKKKRKERLSV